MLSNFQSQQDGFFATFCGHLAPWRGAQKIKIVVKNKHIISVLIFSSITGHGQIWACRSGESGPHRNTVAIFGSLLSHWPSVLYFLIPEDLQREEQRPLHTLGLQSCNPDDKKFHVWNRCPFLSHLMHGCVVWHMAVSRHVNYSLSCLSFIFYPVYLLIFFIYLQVMKVN